MLANRSSATSHAACLTRLVVDVQRAADALLAVPMNDAETEIAVAPAAMLLAGVVDQLMDAAYRAEKLDQSHRGDDLALARVLAGSS